VSTLCRHLKMLTSTRLQVGPICEKCNCRRNSSQDDNERIFWFIFCSSKSGRSCTDCCVSCHSFPFSLSASTLVSVFKPKDEEPYGRLNPKVRIFFTGWKLPQLRCCKTTKWIHRQFRWIIPFGRACLIPNLRFAWS